MNVAQSLAWRTSGAISRLAAPPLIPLGQYAYAALCYLAHVIRHCEWYTGIALAERWLPRRHHQWAGARHEPNPWHKGRQSSSPPW